MKPQVLASAVIPLQDEIGNTLRALAVVLGDKLGRHARSAGAMVELARLNTRLRQLQQWLPSGALASGLEKLQRLLPALLQPQLESVQVRLLAFVLRLLQQLPGSQHAALGASRNTRSTALPLLVPLLRWHQTTSMADNVSLLLAQLVAQLATAWRTQVAPRQCADLLLRLDAVLTFAGHDALHQGFARCAQRLVLARIDASLVHADELPHLWHTLWKLPQLPPVDAEYVHDCNDLALWQAVQADLATHRWQLQQFLQQAAQEQEPRLSYDILLLHYRLPWVVAAAGNAALADYCRLWLHVLLAHWRPQLPLPREVIVLLRDTAALLDLAQWQTLDAASLCRQQLRLLAQSPESLPPGVEVSIAGHPGAVPLGGIPALLATAFDVLMQVRAEWFATADNLELHATRLEAELRFLEQAAAAIRMTVVETMASLVLALLRQVQRLDVMQQWPGALLWRAHRHLLDLLDEAAAWQQPQPDQELLTELRSWLRQAHHDSYRLREPRVDSDALLILSDRLHRFVDAMTLTLDQPVHFTVTVSGMLPVELLASGEIALQTLLREEILAQVQAMPQRRQSLKPRAVAMQLQLHACAASIVAELKSEAVGTALDIATLKRLRRNLPPRAQQVQAEESVANGRRLGLVIAG